MRKNRTLLEDVKIIYFAITCDTDIVVIVEILNYVIK